MIAYVKHSIFESSAQTLVNPVNTVGVMGKGLALSFKKRYPEMFEEYKRLCAAAWLKPGHLHLFRTGDCWILNFPTKEHWKDSSRIQYLDSGLGRFASRYAAHGITSVSFPMLGCGNGGLDWGMVQPLMEAHLGPIPIPVYIHTR